MDQYVSPIGVGFDELDTGNPSPQGFPVFVFVLAIGLSVVVVGTIVAAGAYALAGVGTVTCVAYDENYC